MVDPVKYRCPVLWQLLPVEVVLQAWARTHLFGGCCGSKASRLSGKVLAEGDHEWQPGTI
jgi:hypothetical protein